MPRKVTKKPNKTNLFNSSLVKMVTVCAFIGCAVISLSIELDCAEKEKEQATIQAKIDEYEAENSDLQAMLDSDDLSEYMERIAVEERGYAYPDERRFYDTSRD